MNVSIRQVTDKNRDEILALHVAKNQTGFIETTAQCLQEAKELSLWHPMGIYVDEVPVGFAMYGIWRKDENSEGHVWLDRLLIDEKYQAHGYGKTALQMLIAKISNEYNVDEIYLSFYPQNFTAMHLYEEFGFKLNGELDINGERIMVLKL